MILYVNGDSHSAGAEAVVPFCFAEDDFVYKHLGKNPHPDNLRSSYGNVLASYLGANLHCEAQSASSNTKILRTTRDYLKNNNTPDLIIIGWSTWEREEWFHDGEYWQVNAGGIGYDWPLPIKEKYKDYVINIDWAACEAKAHAEIYDFHLELQDKKIKHLFFNSFHDFKHQQPQDWHNCYIDPYDPKMTYYQWLTNNGFKSLKSFHFQSPAHKRWAEFLLTRLTGLL